ncbi:hypothetical protein KHA80_17345 [Anaerobacillus sp. HL2]|nr:hypothetical protein KHA80_17345 [Anaerobacillus sp. HL2]
MEEDTNIESYKQQLDDLVVNYQQLAKLDLGMNIANEWAFSVELEGAYVIGEIDKIVKKNGDYHLIDLKTNNSSDYEKLTAITRHSYIYTKWLFEQQYRKQARQLSLFFIRNPQAGLRSINVNETLGIEIRNTIKEMIDLKNEIKHLKEEYVTRIF